MKDKELKLEEIEVSDTLGGNGKVLSREKEKTVSRSKIRNIDFGIDINYIIYRPFYAKISRIAIKME